MSVNRERLQPVAGQVIIVEDNSTLCMLMVEVLADLGVDSVAFPTADAALNYLHEAHGNCPLVIADQGLPGQIQGAEFIHVVKQKWPSIASILTSGYELKPDVVPPFSTYLQKPWTVTELENTVENLLQPRSSFHHDNGLG